MPPPKAWQWKSKHTIIAFIGTGYFSDIYTKLNINTHWHKYNGGLLELHKLQSNLFKPQPFSLEGWRQLGVLLRHSWVTTEQYVNFQF